MPLPFYDTTVAVFIRQLKNLSAILQKAEKWCDDNGKPHSEVLEARLAPDMYSLPSQIRLSVRWARNGVLLNKNYHFKSSQTKPDVEHVFAELQAIIQEELDFLQAVKPEDIEGAENRPLSVWTSGEEGKGIGMKFDAGHKLLTQIVFPNFWFHISTAYAICRMAGVPLGKQDFVMAAGPIDCELVMP
ncbi:hypothetical protein BFW01_g3761 [Lasiodiplodia theobromae]|uniref:DUF1993 domain-containing protein n=1 Tax=Lasiodiplodia hormozganensis TaxID=869390 RepID=A0AA39Y938_9PEZI|nr:uncharacterized protein LTHEOB_8099 [Lasiodiplodia theobromae]KAF4541945.1 hypothetical protein LTHEOB_8099 [Lasiodiplodia theobromae]KAF9632898.1 hypothetical protein BFW01_g3761 [Lasiodiplodia theobromae]KAK0647276.1 hypothetical protein DIS24_g7884 [Lasiodiplodia hormozganensis]